MKKRNVLNYLLLCFTFIFAFFIGIHFSLVNAETVNIYNRGGITGYGFEDAHKYQCTNTVYSGVVKIEGPYGEYYCSQCLKSLPDGSWGGVTRPFSYTSTGNVYYTCNDPTTSSYAENQHTIWDLFKGSLSRTNNCSGTAYKLVEFSSDEGGNFQRVVRVEEERPYIPPTPDTYINVTKKCYNGATGTFSFSVVDGNGNTSKLSLNCNETKRKDVAPGKITVTENNIPTYIETSLNFNGGSEEKVASKSFSIAEGETKNIVFNNKLTAGSITIIKSDGDTGDFLKDVLFKLVYINNGVEGPASDVFGNKILDIKTNSEGKAFFSNLPNGKYKVVEVDNPNNLFRNVDPVEVEITGHSDVTLTIENVKNRLYFNKTDINGLEFLPDSSFDIMKGDTLYKNVVVTSLDSYVELEPGEYTIIEKVAPNNYFVLVDPIKINVTKKNITLISKSDYVSLDNKNNRIYLTVKNDSRMFSVIKKDFKSKGVIVGANFELKKDDGTLVKSWTSDKTAFKIFLKPGKYILSEKNAPKDYDKLIDDIKFEIDKSGNLKITSGKSKYFEQDKNNLVIYNDKPVVVPDTGNGLKIGLIVLSVAIVGVGTYFIIKSKKVKEN